MIINMCKCKTEKITIKARLSLKGILYSSSCPRPWGYLLGGEASCPNPQPFRVGGFGQDEINYQIFNIIFPRHLGVGGDRLS